MRTRKAPRPNTTKPRTCFNCGEPSQAQIQTKQLRRTHFICMEKKCWDAYYSKCEEAR